MLFQSNAKINLTLNVLDKDERGYHHLESVMMPVSLADDIEVNIIPGNDIVLSCNIEDIPLDEHNIIYKCIVALKKYCNIDFGVEINLFKRIPIEAGLGGGSSNGATVLKALNNMLDLKLSNQQLIDIASPVGSDIPFFILNQTAVISGFGEKVTPIENNYDGYIFLVKPILGVSTKKAYELYDDLKPQKNIHESIFDALSQNLLKKIDCLVYNDLLLPALSINPSIGEVIKYLTNKGFKAVMMSGSGSCVYGLTDSFSLCLDASGHFDELGYFNWISTKYDE